jgi:hypothetical protein
MVETIGPITRKIGTITRTKVAQIHIPRQGGGHGGRPAPFGAGRDALPALV